MDGDLGKFQDDPKPKGKPQKLPSGDLGVPDTLDTQPKNQTGLGSIPNVNISDYSHYLKQGINPSFDINHQRAQNQSGWQQAGLFLGNLVPNIAGSLLESVGYLGSLVTEWGDDKDYNNFLTQVGKDIRNPLGDIYREHPNEAWDPSDPAWWYQNSEGLVESATAFAAEGVGLAKIFSTIPKAVRALGAGAEVVKGARGLAQLATAATLAYTEGAQQGAQVYDQTYEFQLKKAIDEGVNYNEAKKRANSVASNVAAGSVQLNTIFATILNLTALAPIFKHEDDIANWFKSTAKNAESYDGWKQRMVGLSATDKDIAKLLNPRNSMLASYFSEAGQEGVEELVNQWSQQRGFERGKQGKKYQGLGDMLSDLDSFFDDTMNAQGGLSFALGAVGGVAQTVLLDHIPAHTMYQDTLGNYTDRKFDGEVTPEGKFKKTIVSSHFRNVVGGRKYFENIKDKLLADFTRIDELNADLAKALEQKNGLKAQQAKMKLFDAGALNAVQLGIGDPFIKQYEAIAKIDNIKSLSQNLQPQMSELDDMIDAEQDPTKKAELEDQADTLYEQYEALVGVTEAMKKGFATSPKDNEYQKKAQQAIEDVKEYSKMWEDIQKKHLTGEEWDAHYADYLFNKQVESRRRSQIGKEVENILAVAEAKRLQSFSPEEDLLVASTVSSITANNTARENLIADVKALSQAWIDVHSEDPAKKAEAHQTLKELSSIYSPNAESEDDLEGATREVAKLIDERIVAIDKETNDSVTNITASPSYTAWQEKNAKKGVVDYIQDVRKIRQEDLMLEKERAELRQFQEETKISDSQLKNLQTAKGRNQYIKRAKATRNKLIQSIEANTELNNATDISRLTEGKNVADLDQLQHEQYKASLIREQQAINKEITELNARASSIKQNLEALSKRGLVQRAINKLKEAALTSELGRITARLAILSRRNEAITAQLNDLTIPAKEELFQEETTAEETIISSPLQDLVDMINATKLSKKNKAALLADLAEYKRLVETGNLTFSLNYLAQNPNYTGKGKLSKAKATEIMNAFEKTLSEKKLEVPEIKPTIRPEVQEAMDLVEADIATEAVSPKGRSVELYRLDPEKFIKETAYQAQGANDEGIIVYPEGRKADILRNGFSEETVDAIINAFPAREADITSQDIPTDEAPDSTDGQPLPTDITTYTSLDLEVIAHDGLKVRDASKVNTLTHEYEQDIKKEEDGSLYYVNKDTYTLNPGVNPRYVQPGYLKAGDKVQLVIDTAWDGTTNDTQNFIYGAPLQVGDKFSDYVTGVGSAQIGDSDNTIGNVPIKIVDTRSRTTLGYLPRVDWIEAKYPNVTDDYRNVVNIIYDEDGNVVTDKNVQEQSARILLLRKKLVTAFNGGKKEGLSTTITDRARGHALRVKPGLASELLPDTTLQLGLLGKEAVKIGARSPVETLEVPSYLSKAGSPYSNVPGVLIPDSSGRLNFEPLWTSKLGKAEIETTIRAIEIYLSIGTPGISMEAREQAEYDAAQIEERTGFNLRDSKGLSNFINQYYYFTKSYDDQQMTANGKVLEGQKKTPQFKLSIAKSVGTGFSKAIIKAGVTFLNINIPASIDETGTLNWEFKSLLNDKSMGLASKFRNVIFTDLSQGLSGINKSGELIEVVFQPKSGTFKNINHASYNDMIKSNSKTSLYGKLKLDNGSYVYYANPTTQFNYEEARRQEILVEAKPAVTDITETEKKPVEPIKNADKAREEYLKNLGTNMEDDDFSSSAIRQVTTSAGEVSGIPVSLENLEDLRNFTPVENRNNRPPIEVLEELSKLGLITLPDGYNPFYTC